MTKPSEPIRGKVARVLNAREVALNKGSLAGVEVGMIFKILTTTGAAIKDPDTGEVLGSIELEKTSVKVTVVQDRVAVASTYRTRRINVGGSGFGMLSSGLFEPPKWESRVETLKTSDARREELDEVNAYVNTGDLIVQVIEVS